jgi:hypothetical protein
MAKKRSPVEVGERARKLGDRTETITVQLSDAEIDGEREKVCELIGRKDNLLAAVKSLKADYKAKIEAVDEKISAAWKAAASGKRDDEIIVEEWLTKDNRVMRVRADTNELLGQRVARAEELQETLFEGPAEEGEGFPSADEAFGDGPS